MPITYARPVNPDDPAAPLASYAVRIHSVYRRVLPSGRETFTARWTVARRAKSAGFASQQAAENFASDLRQALKEGEAFDVTTGLPPSMQPREPGPTLLTYAQRFLADRWKATAARTRETEAYALMVAVTAHVADLPGRPRPDVLRAALRNHALLPEGNRAPLTESQAKALAWLERASRPLTDLARPTVLRPVLAALAVNVDGSAASANTLRRRRAVLRHLLERAREDELFPTNPLAKIRWRAPRTTGGVVDPRVVVNPAQAERLLQCVATVGTSRGPRMRAAFACMYYAALRPEEVADLRLQNVSLPPVGWGVLVVDGARPQSIKRYTDSGTTRESRGLKHRADKESRTIPIPPTLVVMLREHVALFGTAADGRIFTTPDRGTYSSSSWSRIWQEARRRALTPEQQASLLAARPYDLRHAALSLWLNAGVPAPEVAKRAGHSLDVLLKIYAKCIDGNQQAHNDRIGEALR